MARLLALAAAAGIAAAYTEVWPMPQTFTTGSTPTVIAPEFLISCAASSPCPDPLPAAFARYNNIIFFAGSPSPVADGANVITGLELTIGAQANLTLGVSENYTLNVPTTGLATATADTQWGALRAIESFAQLAVWSGYYGTNGSQYVIDSAPVSITDFPRWRWRSLLIDSSRHFLTPSAIKVTLDGMAANKLNRLHWHIVDDNSWPLYSATFPNLTLGAYGPDAIYYHEDVADIVEYAWERGISIMPEFDMPAHADAWGRGFPNLVISCAEGQSLLNPVPASGIYDVVGQLLDEFLPLFRQPDTVHFGGDEVQDLTCWNNSAEVQAFMKSQGLADVNAVRNFFESQLQSIAKSKGADSMFWEEVFDDAYTLLPTSIVDIWLSYDEVAAAIKSGHNIVSSFGLYLDQQTPFGGTHYFWGDTWQCFYLNDPTFNANFTLQEEALILGENLSQWGEQVDEANIESRIWPRACGGAERMWSDRNLRDVNAAEGRLDHHRCHLVQRGIGAGPIRPASEYGYCPLPDSSRFNRMHEKFVVPARA